MLRGKKTKSPLSLKDILYLTAEYALNYSMTVMVKIVGFNQWREQGRAYGGKEERTNLFGTTK